MNNKQQEGIQAILNSPREKGEIKEHLIMYPSSKKSVVFDLFYLKNGFISEFSKDIVQIPVQEFKKYLF